MKKLSLNLELIKRLYYEENKSLIDITREVGCSYTGLCNFFNRNNLKRRKKTQKGDKISGNHLEKIRKNNWSKTPARDEILSKLKKVKHPTLSEESKKKISDLNKGQGNPNFGKFWTEQQKEALSQKKKEMYKNDPSLKEKIKKNHWSKNSFYREILSENSSKRMSELISSGRIHMKNGFVTGSYVSEKTKEKMNYHSSYELERMIFLDSRNEIKFFTKNHNIVIYYIDLELKQKRYIPDFYVVYNNGSIFLEEVKGFIRDKNVLQLKNTAAKKYADENNIQYRILYKKDLKEIV